MKAAGEKQKSWQKVLIDLPMVGPWFNWISIHLGMKSFLSLLAGAMIVGVLVFAGRWPEIAVSSKYKTGQEVVVRVKPDRLDILSATAIPFASPEQWHWPYIRYLQEEGDKEKLEKWIKGYMVGVIESVPLPATPKFAWVLKPSPGFHISGYAFRVADMKSSTLFEPLKKEAGSPADSVRVAVPQCEKGDKLVAVVRVSWQQDITTPEFRTTFHSAVE